MTVKETWGTGVGDVVEVVAAEQVEGMEPCGARLTPGSEAFLFLSNEASSDTDVFYPVVVLTKDASSGEYIDSSGRIPNHGGAGHRGRTDGQHGVIGT
ncbi:MAG: hypothetical protein Q4P15_13900 [Propionibacteriaceae bacterium]|nr:hypothetical protein [Propionibacteriaceae bacterium]